MQSEPKGAGRNSNPTKENTMFGLALATGTTGGIPDRGIAAFQQMIPLIFMFAIFYFLLIRPRKKKALAHKAMLESIKRGDCVITTGGLHGRVFSVEDDDVILDGSYGVNVRITKSFVATVKKD